MPNPSDSAEDALKETARVSASAGNEAAGDVDLSLLEESLRLTPWERMLANDDALNLAESLRAGMERRHAES
jgi:hypothetical protein